MPVEQLIFTDLARGKGVDLNLKGYQVKACSKGLSTADREQLGAIALHFRTSVYENAPKSAHDSEQAWRMKTENLDEVPEDVLKEFPHVWSYAQLGMKRFALTRVRYAGLTHDQRPGNFFAHSLVFEPECLDAHHSNPLLLSRSNVFLSNDSNDSSERDPLPDLGTSGSISDINILRADPYTRHLAAMLHALMQAPISGRAVLICLDDWRVSAPLVEALLSLLPHGARCRTTFCTLENDRRWSGPQAATRTVNSQSPAHHLIVVYKKDARSLELLPNEYEKTFTVFNFPENKTSPLEEPGAYARFASQCSRSDSGMWHLQQHHELVRLMGCDENRSCWDVLVEAVGLPSPPSGLKNAVRALCTVAQSPQQADSALRLLHPSVLGLAEANRVQELNDITPDLAPLVDRVPTECDLISILRHDTEKAFIEGRTAVAAALLQLCLRQRDEILKTLAVTPIESARLTEQDQRATVEILLNSLRLFPPPLQPILRLFEAAEGAQRTAEVWRIAGESAVKGFLAENLQVDEKTKFLRDLADRVPSATAPDANVWLRTQLIETTNPQGDALLNELVALAIASAGCAKSEVVGDLILKHVGKLEAQERAVALGRLAEATQENPLAERLFAEYRGFVKGLGGKQQTDARRQLAADGILNVLCREFIEDVLQQDVELGRDRLNSWRDRVLNTSERLLDETRLQLAKRLMKEKKVLWLAEELLSGTRGTGRGFAHLCESVAQSLPMEALSPTWRAVLMPPPENISEDARARLVVLDFLWRLESLASKDDWSIENFPSTKPPSREIRILKADERAKVQFQCIESVVETGITSSAQARAFLEILSFADNQGPETVAQAVEQLLRGRDDVTRIQVATAFTQLALDGDLSQKWDQVVVAITRRFDRNVLRLFESHLEHRFHKSNQKYDDRLRHLRQIMGLGASVKASSTLVHEPEAKSNDAGGVFGKMTNAFRKLMRESSAEDFPKK
jgi:hypothetical protein